MPTESGFVAGTLVHTQEGLKPIEQIKVGDYVLSKPDRGGEIISAVEAATTTRLCSAESAEGKVSYKRVTRTFESESDELYYIAYFCSGCSG